MAAEAVPSTVEIARGREAGTVFELGRDVYNYRCYFCHGYAGDGKTLAATYLEPKPRDFSATVLTELSRERMLVSVTHGRAGTAMKSFKEMLTEAEIVAVVDFVRQAFMGAEQLNTGYHTLGNGWPNHERFAIAFPFATGEIPLDADIERLTASQQAGRNLFMASCITCHDRAKVDDEGVAWGVRVVSYPRGGYSHREPDSVSAATPYSGHDKAPVLPAMSAQEQQGEALYQANCAFCHAADGSGKNWIGRFLEPPARDLTTQSISVEGLAQVIRDGLPGTTMPAWRFVLEEGEIEAISAYVMKAFVIK